MEKRRILPTTLVLTLFLALAGCGGGGAQIKNSSTTLGQELIDLEKAHKEGIISDTQYDKAKKEILNKYQ